ncbi:HNH endonuclease [Nocardioides aromaticivorans]|uniref:HNH endonuclease n=2 Tax=Nocardioides aromaticivorans TaxID=200618 RepID=A0ABX7PHN5_9ACTN|nr:HNH endonuclease [Nocardioides aromaticivorans]
MGMAAQLTAEEVRSFVDRITAGVCPDDPAAQIDVIAALETLKSAAAAVQAELSVVYDARRRANEAAAGVGAARQGRGVASEIALARRESPHRGQVLLGLAKVLRTEMPHTLARLRDGSLSEFRAMLLARETACLPVELRMFADEETCADPAALAGVGTRELVGRIRRLVAELDPAAVARRARKAASDRNVTVRPAPDTMTYLTALVPVAQGVAAYAALRKAAEAARAAGDPRSLGQLMSDLMVARVTGVADTGTPEAASAVPVTVDVVISDESLAGGHAPAEVSADGVPAEVVPAEVARNLLAQAIDQPADSEVISWFRCLYRNRLGRLVAMTTRSRFHTKAMGEFLALRGAGICAIPFCDAPVRHNDHITPVADGGDTTVEDGQGLCQTCNHAKQAPGWRQHQTGHERDRHQVETITPTGHRYTATAPAPPGWREPRYVQTGPGRYQLIA